MDGSAPKSIEFDPAVVIGYVSTPQPAPFGVKMAVFGVDTAENRICRADIEKLYKIKVVDRGRLRGVGVVAGSIVAPPGGENRKNRFLRANRFLYGQTGLWREISQFLWITSYSFHSTGRSRAPCART